MHDRVRPWTVLAEKNFALLWSSLLISGIGSQLTSVAIAWQVYEITDSPLQLGLTGLFRAAPLIGFALTGGWLADRVERRRLLIATQTLALFMSLSLALLTQSGAIRVWEIYVILFAQSALMSFDLPTRDALIPNLVPAEHLASAFALTVTLRQAAFLAGPFIGGAVIAWAGTRWCYYLDAASFLAVIVCLAFMKIRAAAARRRETGLRSMLEGFAFIRRNALIFALLVTDACVNFFGAYRGLMPIFARDLLGVGPSGLGALLGAPALGALAGSGIVIALGNPRRKARLIVTITLLYTAGLVAFALSRSFLLSLAIAFTLGALDAVGETLRMTVVQLMTPDELRGRVQAVVFIFVIGGPFLGQAELGLVASFAGATGALVLGGILASGAVALMARTIFRADEM
ncbi:MAG TPA: MFS transporter [Verrucomicrobiae bacterium]|nr:MFS transporter [Verrucomicrobiae bacterium]